MTDIKKIREILSSGKVSLGTWLQFNSPDVAELMAKAGYDWVVVDMEHGSFSNSDLPSLFRAIESAGSVPFVRLSEAHKVPIKAALDAGAHGLIFPRIENYKHLNYAINHALYPHLGGERGYGYCRANNYGKDFDEYGTTLAHDIFFVAQIEHISAVHDLENIVSHPRLDAIMVGPYDLSGSMNIVGEFEHPKFKDAMQKVTTVCRKHNINMGIHIATPDQQALKNYMSHGYTFIAYGVDSVFLWKSAARPVV